MRYQKQEEGSKNVNLTEISGQNKVFCTIYVENLTSSAIDANTYHTVVAVCTCIAYQLYGKSDKMV